MHKNTTIVRVVMETVTNAYNTFLALTNTYDKIYTTEKITGKV